MEVEKENKAEKLSYLWMGTHLQGKDIQEVITTINSTELKKNEPSVKEVNSEWRRLASSMNGHR